MTNSGSDCSSSAGCGGLKTEEELDQYEEYQVLREKLELATYDVVVEKDNSGSRS